MTNPSTVPDPYERDRGLPLDPEAPAAGYTATGAGSSTGFDDFSGSSYESAASAAGTGYADGPSYDQSASTKDVAKEEAASTKDSAAGAAKQVAQTAKSEIGNVTSEVGNQAKDLLQQTRGQVREQIGSQQNKLAATVHSLAKELGSMGASSDAPGPASDLAQQASRKVGEVGHWLESNEPEDVLESVKNFARRKPGTFLLGAALAGVVVGRLSRTLGEAAKAEKDARDSASGYSGTRYADTSYAGTGYAGAGYATGAPTDTTGYGTAASQGLDSPIDPTIPQTGAGSYGRGDVTP
ncbi:MAG TPA: hypothetical protein VFP89_09865 [Propionibacteriaceae bacterium]|nr:hypothetical protein [Propionibacteriaceae bacterium]